MISQTDWVIIVALRKESVDRNINAVVSYNIQETSLSARRAWIEILSAVVTELLILLSLSARRAWIEISVVAYSYYRRPGRSPQGERG